MPINDLPVLSVLRTKMQWHQERQRVLSEKMHRRSDRCDKRGDHVAIFQNIDEWDVIDVIKTGGSLYLPLNFTAL